MLSTQLQNAFLADAIQSQFTQHTPSNTFFIIARANATITHPNYTKLLFTMPINATPNLYTFEFLADSLFQSRGLNFCYFSNKRAFNNVPASTLANTIMSNTCRLIYTRYISFHCRDMTFKRRYESYINGKSDNSLLITVNLDFINGAINKTISSNNEIVILTRGAQLDDIQFVIMDEYSNILNFGYDSNNFPYDNQFLLTFTVHD
jgi:hypothetical protein